MQEVEEEENRKGFIMIEYSELEVHDANGDVTVRLTAKSDAWTITGDSQRVCREHEWLDGVF